MITLGIETSCDETSVSVTSGKVVWSNIVSSSVHLHKRYGGVVPEIASRFHVEYIIEVLSKALERSGRRLDDLDLVAVTNGPGLIGALLVGISLAKAISYSRGVPLIGVNHVLAHLNSAFLSDASLRPRYPFVGLIVSGGHTSLFYCRDVDEQKFLGQTQDDAVGEAYDKVAKLLGLGYPGGPIIEKMASRAKRKSRITFPKSYLGKDSLDFSFSGIKTAVLYYVRDIRKPETSPPRQLLSAGRGNQKPEKLNRELVSDVCYAFQEAVLDVLVDKTCLAANMYRVKRVVVGGGVAANSRLRVKLRAAAKASGMEVYFPEFEYCLDNAAMVGVLGEELYRRGHRSDLYLNAQT